MNILITGLTLHNNKGGPALALSLKKKLNTIFKSSKFYLAVPNFDNNIFLEEKWAEFYGFEGVVGSVGAKELLLINMHKRDVFLSFLKSIDLVVDLNALSYMDLRHKTYKQNLVNNLSIYTIRGFCNKLHTPLIRWTQSYGPFMSYITKQIVKYDLKNQKNIFVRGKGSFENIQKILPNKKIFSFPDIAIILDKKEEYYSKHLIGKKYITLSPSSVIYSKDQEKHIEDFRNIVNYIKKLDYEIVFVPHNLMSINPSLYNCDLKVSEKIIDALQMDNIHLVSQDIDVYNLKGIIANAILHIGARYHSVIASLSTGVPTIAFSWHEKYKDIMRMYNMENYVYDEKSNIKYIYGLIDKLLDNREKYSIILKNSQKKLNKDIDRNIELFMENYNELQDM